MSDSGATITTAMLPATVVNTSRYLAPTGGDDTANMIAAIAALAGQGTIILGPGVFQWTTSVPTLPAGATGIRIQGSGVGETIIRCSSGAPRFLDFNRTADYQTFQNIEVTDLTVDANNIGGQGHVVIGTYNNWTTSGQRVNLDNIIVRRVTVINAPSDADVATNHRLGVVLQSYHPGVNEATQTRVTRILVEDFTMFCGNAGVLVAGQSPAGGANVLLDDVWLSRCKHTIPLPKLTAQVVLPADTITTFTLPVDATAGWAASGHVRGRATDGTIIEVAYASLDATDFLGCTVVTGTSKTLATAGGVGYPVTSNFQVGGRAIGGRCGIRDIKAGGSGDNGLEVNALTNALVENMEIVDDLNAGFVQINYQNPQYPLAQRIVYRDCVFRRTDPSAQPTAFLPGNATSIANLQEVVFERCKLYVDSDNSFSGSGQAIAAGVSTGAKIQKLVVRGFTVYHNGINAAITGAVTINWFLFNSTLARAVYEIDGIDAEITGAVTGGFGTNSRLIAASGTDTQYSIDRVRWLFNVTGTSGNGTRGIEFGTSAAVVRGTVSRFVIRQLVATTPWAIRFVSGSLTMDAKHTITISQCDFGALASGAEISHATASSSAPYTRVRDNIWSNRPAPTTLTGLVSGTGLVLATGWDASVVFTQGSGAGVTAIDYSTDAGAHYTNVLTQAAGPLPAGLSEAMGPLPSDALIKVTFTTTQPTVNLIPAAP